MKHPILFEIREQPSGFIKNYVLDADDIVKVWEVEGTTTILYSDGTIAREMATVESVEAIYKKIVNVLAGRDVIYKTRLLSNS